ncbi:disease resistance protein RUN1-like [Carya illinoinensis]|uniref:disease resistance protein RUN1-like n=1 Tax=Carya illinoinensis TaxID=32201 RepID=UPI001C7271C2|nr:disease resistance protein RUN1-like [Carya illinoinensis]XP_042956564.1 disease resistance protein RUN1-like [Carya illinoinensis]XP_042956565.1 disease resistance protein RUN1-like [Carya illinoinensis]XP_042956566.1 disease resistance protein RUN1-like [Carya illinoinensis]XP_042956567.1 disease resistance protein RUN1-like [Carya illinoinensis]
MVAQSTLPSASKTHWDHDVFLSFRGEETRKNFTDHLYSALVQAGIHTFRDDDGLRRGENISSGLLNAIRGSKISIVVFSKDYASSRWCLDELVEIVKCQNTTGHTLVPIFYNVDPSDVRKQTGTFAEAFIRHEERFRMDMERVKRWRAALTEAANCSGWDLLSVANGYEANFIEKIVEDVSNKVKPVDLFVAKHLVGVNSRVQVVKTLINLGANDVRAVGIYGMGGAGKTTIAKAVYNEIYDRFKASSYLSDIKEKSKSCDGIVHLQEQLLSNILKMKNLKIDSVDGGIRLIQEKIHGKRILVVLDDVDDLDQVHKLVGNFKGFGLGSRLILTTRDEHLLTQLKVDEKYKVGNLNPSESLQLFSWYAFEMAHPRGSYSELSDRAVKYAGGLPLALEVLGSFLKRRSIREWTSELEKLQRVPHNRIQKILRISFDSLDVKTMDIFLDIACFFIGMDKEYVNKILHGCDLFPDIGMSILVQRSLVTIDLKHKLRMHDLTRDMGREIVRERSQGYVEKSCRLWFHDDVLKVLTQHKGSDAVKGLALNPPILEDLHLKTEAFANMKNLMLLQINNVILNLEGCFENISKELRWLQWNQCPLKYLPSKIHLENLVVLDMQHSSIKQVWKENRILQKLKILNLSYSKNLTKSPCFIQVPHLEMLIFEGCTSLDEVHESIGHLERLVLLNLEGCKNLKNLPRSIPNLVSLETLNLTGCLKLDKLPEQLGNMIALRELIADGTAIKQLPSSVGLLKNLKTVSLSACEGEPSNSWFSCFSLWMSPKSSICASLLPASISGLSFLQRLVLRQCNLSEDGFPVNLGSLFFLRDLDLSGNDLRNLPYCISQLPKVQYLYLNECSTLQSISGLPTNVRVVYANECTSVERLSLLSNVESRRFFFLRNCHKLVEIEGLESFETSSVIHMEGCNNMAYDFRNSLLQCPSTKHTDRCGAIFLPGSEVPDWFNYQNIGSSISFHVPSLSKGEIRGLLVCAVYAAKEEPERESATGCHMKIYNRTRGFRYTDWKTLSGIALTCEDHFFVYHAPLLRNKLDMKSGDEMEVSIEPWRAVEVQKCGIHLIVDEPIAEDESGSKVQQVDSDTRKDGACHGGRFQ